MVITNELRRSVIDTYIKGFSNKDIANILNINVSSVYAIIKVYLTENRIDKKLKGGVRKRALTDAHIQAIQNYIDLDCSITLQSMRQKLKNDFNIEVSTMTICRYIKSFNYTLKSITLIPLRRNDAQSIDAREAYANTFFNLLSDLDESRLYFVDEVGFNVSMRSKRGRSFRGTNAVETVAGIRSRNISVCCSMTKSGIANYNVQVTPYNTITFKAFISSLLQYIETNRVGKSAIIMDNVAFHKNRDVKAMIEVKGHIVLFLPPYSPFLNPIENMFSKWKQAIRREKPNNEKKLFELIENVNSIISGDDCAGYYRHMIGFLPKCLKREPITEG